jgi:CO/xanthine dehydrogenase Mo-binding subunit
MKSTRALLTIASLLVLSATSLSAQAGSVACMDGSRSVGGRGACSGHGGVQTAARKAEAKADAKAAKAMKAAEAKSARAEKKVAKADAKSAVSAMRARNDDHEAKGATAECKDHTYSHAKSRQGACSGHGGVSRFLGGR